MKIGILGSGDVAQALAKGFVGRGDQVKLGTRDPTKAALVAWAGTTGGKATIGTFAEAAQFAEVAVLATRGVASAEILRLADPRNLADKIVIDVTNPLLFPANAPPALAVGHTDSAGEQVQRALPASKVVKAFNIVGSPHMVHPAFPGGPPDMIICGNDAGAKKAVTQILRDFGWPTTIDIGGIEGSRMLEPLCLLWVHSALALGTWDVAFKLIRK